MGIIATIERAPTENGGHTSYYLLQEDNSNIVKPFPLNNFMLCDQKHKDKIESQIKERGFQLVLDN